MRDFKCHARRASFVDSLIFCCCFAFALSMRGYSLSFNCPGNSLLWNLFKLNISKRDLVVLWTRLTWAHMRTFMWLLISVVGCLRVVFMDVPTDTILERLTLRSVDPVTGERWVLGLQVNSLTYSLLVLPRAWRSSLIMVTGLSGVQFGL